MVTGLRWVLLFTSLGLVGCGGLQETWEGPQADTFRPKSVAVLPPIVGAFEGARDGAHQAVTTALKESRRYEQVIPAQQVNAAIQGSKDLSDALVAFYSQIETVGSPDKATAVRIGQALKADALVVVKVNSWEYARVEGDNLAKVAMGLRLVDAKTGVIVWKGRHETTKNYMMFKPKLQDLAADLSAYMVKYSPKVPASPTPAASPGVK
jgi:ABC-type uncharacterized transport system auxiliary subunit